METIRRSALVCGFLVVVSACGGGGSGGSKAGDVSGKSLAELNDIYEALRDKAYQGNREQASVSATTILPIARLLFSGELPSQTEQAMRQISSSTAFVEGRKRVANNLSDDTTRTVLATSVNEQENCDNTDGRISFSGTLNEENGNGALNLTYTNCEFDGIVMDGPGAMFIDNSTQEVHEFFDHVSMRSADQTVILTGAISVKMYQDITTSNVVLEEKTSGFSLQMENYLESIASQGNLSQITVQGRLYHSTLGFVEVIANYSLDDDETHGQGSATFEGAGDTLGTVTLDGSFAKIELDDRSAQDSPIGVYISLASLLSYEINPQLDFVAVDQLHMPPQYETFSFVSDTVTTLDDIEAAISGITDREGNPVSVSYRWLINGVQVADQSTYRLPAGVAKKDDEVTVYALLNNGYVSVDTQPIRLTVADAPATVVLQDLPETVNINEEVQFSAVYTDPDGEDVANVGVELAYGPAGVSLAANGLVTWVPQTIMFADAQALHFGFYAGDSDVRDVTVTVNQTDAGLPEAFSSVFSPTGSSSNIEPSLVVGQFDDDTQPEILLLGNNNGIFTLEKRGNDFVQDWLYPYASADGLQYFKLLAADINADQKQDVFAVTQRTLSVIADRRKIARVLYALTDEGSIIRDAEVADIDGDGNLEAILLLGENLYTNSNIRMQIIEINNGSVSKTIELSGMNSRVAVGNVDSDEALEIIVNGGFVYDGKTGNNEWYYGSGFGGFLAIGDVDGNGVQEIITNTAEGIAAFSAVGKSRLWLLSDFRYVRGLVSGNIDNDSQAEILISSGNYPYELFSYDAGSGFPELEWRGQEPISDNANTAYGDIDSDGEVEVLWMNSSNLLSASEYTQPSLTMTASDPLSSSTYSAAGRAKLADDGDRSIFVIPRGYSTLLPRVVSIGDQRQMKIENVDNDSNQGGSLGVVADYDGDDLSELFLLAASMRQGLFSVLQLSDLSEIWTNTTSSSSYYNETGSLVAVDLNDDTYLDAVYSNNRQVVAIDILNQELLWSSLTFVDAVKDVQVIDSNGDGKLEIVVATANQLSIWKTSSFSIAPSVLIDSGCDMIQVGNFDNHADIEIACLLRGSTYSSYSKKIVVYSSQLSEKWQMQFDDVVLDMAVVNATTQKTNLIMSFKNERSYNAYYTIQDQYYLAEIDAQQGAVIWRSPYVLGVPAKKSLKSFTDASGRQRLNFATNKAMFVTH